MLSRIAVLPSLIAFIFLISACQEGSRSPRAPSGNNPNKQARGDKNPGEEIPDGDDTQIIDSEGGDDGEDDPENLPRYLLTKAQASVLIKTPFLAPKSMPGDIERARNTTMPAASGFQSFLQKFIDDTLSIKDLKATQKVSAFVVNSIEPNATMDAWYQMVVYNSFLPIGTDGSLLATLCHELGHAARNHGYFAYFPDQGQNPGQFAAAGFLTEIERYFGAQYRQGTYRHDAARYQELYKKWQAVGTEYSIDTKRAESEADVLGVHICSHLGMTPDRYASEIREAFLDLGGLDEKIDVKPANLRDGETVQVPEDQIAAFVLAFLFPIDSHPKGSERVAQVQRLSTQIKAKQPGAPKMLETWLDEYPTFRKSLAPSGIRLTSESHSHMVTIGIRDDGSPIQIRRKSCTH